MRKDDIVASEFIVFEGRKPDTVKLLDVSMLNDKQYQLLQSFLLSLRTAPQQPVKVYHTVAGFL